MYEIKFLSNNDFDSLPAEVTRGSDISDSMGFYNPYMQKAFIRYTAYPELNKYLLNHEFEHMLEDPDHPTDVDENGIRHKKFFKELFLPFFFPPLFLKNAADKRKRNESDQAYNAQQEAERQRGVEGQSFQNFLSSQPVSSGQSTFGGSQPATQQSSLGGLNQPLNQLSTNPFAPDQERFRYGAPAGRLQF